MLIYLLYYINNKINIKLCSYWNSLCSHIMALMLDLFALCSVSLSSVPDIQFYVCAPFKSNLLASYLLISYLILFLTVEILIDVIVYEHRAWFFFPMWLLNSLGICQLCIYCAHSEFALLATACNCHFVHCLEDSSFSTSISIELNWIYIYIYSKITTMVTLTTSIQMTVYDECNIQD